MANPSYVILEDPKRCGETVLNPFCAAAFLLRRSSRPVESRALFWLAAIGSTPDFSFALRRIDIRRSGKIGFSGGRKSPGCEWNGRYLGTVGGTRDHQWPVDGRRALGSLG